MNLATARCRDFCGGREDGGSALDRLDPVLLAIRLGAPNDTALNTIATARYRCTAALDVKTGQVQGMTAGRHTSKEFIAFLEGLVARTGWARELHVVLDNRCPRTRPKTSDRFLAEHPHVHFHFTRDVLSILAQSGRALVR